MLATPAGPGRPEELKPEAEKPEEAKEPELGEPPELEEMLEAEMEAEETRPEELRLEAEELEETRLAAASEPIHPKTMKIGGHEVVEELREGEDVSYFRCLKCGLTVRLDEVASLTDTPCTEERGQEAGAEQRTEQRKAETSICEYCGAPSIGSYPIEYVSGSPMNISICADCAKKIEELYVNARPNIADRSGRRLIRCRHPMESRGRKVAWHSYTKTWFVADEDGRWPCPACGAIYYRLLDAIKHFVEKHPELSRSGREYVASVGEVWKTWQGYYCPCGLLLADAKALREHYESHRR